LGATPAHAGAACRTPQRGQTSAFALMAAPHSEQNFSSGALWGISAMTLYDSL
jgi:hypothetical protein